MRCTTVAVAVVAATIIAVVDAAFAPGWEPPLCLDDKYRPLNISVDLDPTYPAIDPLEPDGTMPVPRFFIENRKNGNRMEPVFLKGIGYSPIPPSKFTYERTFDMFTKDFKYLWRRDLERIKEIGANVIRVWSWDSFSDHTEFLDEVYKHDLLLMVPFMFNFKDYLDLDDPSTRKQALQDWRAFVQSVMNHPAVFCYLIGNELNTHYGSQRSSLFSLINEMADIRDEVDKARHPMTLPLSDVSFVSDYFNLFFAWSRLDFWALQTYRPNRTIELPIGEYYNSWNTNWAQTGAIKPLVITEFGADALPHVDVHQVPSYAITGTEPPEQQTKQADYLCTMFSEIRSPSPIGQTGNLGNNRASNAMIVAGTVVMEWNDEWWKGSYADARAPMCPNKRTELHTWCAHNIGGKKTPYYLHEEWLGLTAQVYDEAGEDFCLCRRASYNAIQKAYQCSDGNNDTTLCWAPIRNFTNGEGEITPRALFHCMDEPHVPCSGENKFCGKRRNFFLNPYMSMGAPVFVIMIALGIVTVLLRRIAVAEEASRENDRRLSRLSFHDGEVGDGAYIPEEDEKGPVARKLRDRIAAAFREYTDVGTTDHQDTTATCPYFLAGQERLFKLIWDKYVSCEGVADEMLDAAARIVYEQYMEGYYLWLGTPPDTSAFPLDQLLPDLALMNIIQTWAGTVNHAPEKICEVFGFAQKYFEHCVPSNHGPVFRRRQVKQFHLGLVEIMRTYYLKVDQANFTFEDINEDAMQYRKAQSQGVVDDFWFSRKQEVDTKARGFSDSLEFQEYSEGLVRRDNTVEGPLPIGADCPDLDLLPKVAQQQQLHPYLEYHKQRNPEETLLSDASQAFFDLHTKVAGVKWITERDAFPQKGGPFTMLFNYGWVVRYLIWQSLWARNLQPVSIAPPVCMCDAAKMLAVVDSVWMACSGLLHLRVLGWVPRLRPMIETIAYGIFALAIVSDAVFPFMKKPTEGPSVSNFFGMGMTIDTFYIIIALLVLFAEELYLFVKPSPAYPIPARFTTKSATVRIRAGFIVTFLLALLPFIILQAPLSSSGSIISSINTSVAIPIWPDFVKDLVILLTVVVSCGCGWLVARLMARCSVDAARKTTSRRSLNEEADVIVLTVFFWGLFFVLNFLAAYYILVPAVNNITFQTCTCPKSMPQFSEAQRHLCEPIVRMACYLGVIFTWFSTALVCFVVLYGVFEILLLIFGFFRAKVLRVGNVQSWADVARAFELVHIKCVPVLSWSLHDPESQRTIWNGFIDALAEDCLLNKKEVTALKVADGKPRPDFRKEPRSDEASRRIIYHLWSLQGAHAHPKVASAATHTNYRKLHRVRTMPTWTCVVPVYSETIIFEEEQLTRARTPGKLHFRLTEIEYLIHTFSDEWDAFAERMKDIDSSWVVNADNYPADLCASFLRTPGSLPITEETRFEVRWWATMRGQTLARTLTGLVNWRNALVTLLKLEEPGIPEIEAQRIVSRKCQILITHQTANVHADIMAPQCDEGGFERRLAKEALEICFRRLKYFDVAYNDDDKFQSYRRRLKPEFLASGDEAVQGDIKFVRMQTVEIVDKSKKVKRRVERAVYNVYPESAFDFATVQRVGRLKIGEGKAENQMHALQFVNGVVLQAMDMNQYCTTENGYKLPFVLSDYFATPDPRKNTGTWESSLIIPPYRVVGFVEWCYTRKLSLVGDFMGAAEWCFVTITQRVLNWPLRIRLHYGHPDFIDAFWVRNRGGQSKASPLVHTNEDIFLGYEMLGRGDRGAYIEFLEAQKGREVTFAGAATFEGKLAQGGAQQIRSFDVYRLNRGLDGLNRFSLFFSSLAFYVTNLLMAISVKYYILSIALFAVSGISYHELGLLDAVIAVPWLIQIGYVLALPFIVELTLQRGLARAIYEFLRTLLPSLLFFIFHLRTKMYFFAQGLLIGKGGYAGTGRGFGLDRPSYVESYKAFSESHYHEALLIFSVLVIYASYGIDPVGAYLLRTFTIILIVVSWMWAPLIFSSAPTTQDLQIDTGNMMEWINAQLKLQTTLEEVERKLKTLHFGRVHSLVSNLGAECASVLTADELKRSAKRDEDSCARIQQQARIMEGNDDDEEVLETATRRSHCNSVNTEGLQSLRDFRQADFGADAPVQQLLDAALNEEEQIAEALITAHHILSTKKQQLETAIRIQTATAPHEPIPRVNETYTSLLNNYWQSSGVDTWVGWWLRHVVMMQWESEDEFFPGLLNLFLQKVLLVIELFTPWIVLCVTEFHVDSLWFLYLVLMAIGVHQLVAFGFTKHHEYSTMARSLLILTAPLAYFYFRYSIMTARELFWSMLLYVMITMLIIEGVYGCFNLVGKLKTFRSGNPYQVAFTAAQPKTGTTGERIALSVRNRTKEMSVTNDVEERRFHLFRIRIQYLEFFTLFRVIVPLACIALMVIGNAITVILSEWITAMNFNGRVNEAWKRAYLRPGGGAGGDHGSAGSPAGANAPGSSGYAALTGAALSGRTAEQQVPPNRKQEVAREEQSATTAAVSGTLVSSLQPGVSASLLRGTAGRSRHVLTSSRMHFPQPPSSRTMTGSVDHDDDRSVRDELDDNDLTDPLLQTHNSQGGMSSGHGVRPAPFFSLRKD